MMRPDRLDHLIWAAADLDQGIDHLEALSGVRAAVGGRHPGFGTRNALAGLGPGLYLEILAPDPGQDRTGTLGALVAGLAAPSLIGWSACGDDLDGLAARLPAAGLATPGRIAMTRTRPDGLRLDWSILGIGGHDFGALIPFLIDWQACPHPADSAPAGLRLDRFSLKAPDPLAVASACARLGIDLRPSQGKAGLYAEITGPKGPFTLATRGELPDRTFGR